MCKSDEEQLRKLGLLSLEKRSFRGDLVLQLPDRRLGSAPRLTSNRMRGELCHGRFRLDSRENFLLEEVVKHWKKLSKPAVVTIPGGI